MYRNLTLDEKGNPQDPVSSYNPSDKIKDRTAQVLCDYQYAESAQQSPRVEFNNRSLIEEIDDGYRMFNSYVPPKSTDPDEAWRAQTVRPLTRNKLISTAAHVTTAVLFPNVFAQDDQSNEDKQVAQVMRDLIEYTINESDYSRSFIQAAITGLVEPAVIVESKYYEVYRTVKRPKAGGKGYKEEKILDEALSGYRTTVVPCNELMIANFYEPDIQKQRFLVRSRYIDFAEAKLIYGNHEDFKYVKPGVFSVFHTENRMFYDVYDQQMKDYLVNETIYENRAEDLRLVFINGILVTDVDEPNPRMDKLYGYAKSVHEPINSGQFFYGKSAVAKLYSDQVIVDTLYNMVLDGTFLQLMPPMATYGSEEADAGVYIPGTITSFRGDRNSVGIESIAPKQDLRAGLEAIGLVERSMAESSQESTQGGVAQGGERTAREVLVLQQNAKIALGLFGKQIAFLVEDIGKLRVGEILQFMTSAEVRDLTTGDLKYQSFLVPNKMEEGKNVSRKIQFTTDMLGSDEMSDLEKEDMSFDVLEEEGGIESETRIYKVNPELFRKMKYRIVVNADELTPRSKELEKALDIEAYDRLIQNPVIDQTAVTKEFLLNTLRPGDADKFIMQQQPMGMEGAGLPNRAVNQKGVDTSFLSQMTGSNSLGAAAATDTAGIQGSMTGSMTK